MKKIPAPQQYDPPVEALLQFGDPREMRSETGWPDYIDRFHFSEVDVPDLVRMVQDDGLNWADSESLEVWAPVHAWRTLAQLGAAEAVPDLLAIFHLVDEQDSEWVQDEMPTVFEMIGPTAVPDLRDYLLNKKKGMWSRVTASAALENIGKKYDDGRDACVSALISQLKQYKNESDLLNGFVISALISLNAKETKALIEAAFAANKVDISIEGDWEDVQVKMGWLETRVTPAPHYFYAEQERLEQKAAASREQAEQAKINRRWAHQKAKKTKAKKKRRRR